MDKMKEATLMQAKVPEHETTTTRRQSDPMLRRRLDASGGGIEHERSAKSEPIPPFLFVS